MRAFHSKSLGFLALSFVACVGFPGVAHAENRPEPSAHAHDRRSGFAVMLGLGQWALGGGNVAVQYNVGPLAVEYSHGQGVHLS